MNKVTAGVSTLLATLIASHAQAATLLMLTEQVGDEIKMSKMWIDADRYRIESSTSEGKSLEIFDKDRIYGAEFEEYTYSVLDRASLVEDAERYDEATRRGIVKPTPKPVRELRDTEQYERVGDQPCRVWDVFQNGKLVQKLCVRALKTLPTGAAIRKTMDSYNKLHAAFDLVSPAFPWGDVETTQGFPVIVANYTDGKIHSMSTAVIVNTNELTDAMTYVLPPGMRERKEE